MRTGDEATLKRRVHGDIMRNPPTLMKLSEAARLIGVRAATVESNQQDFVGVKRLGGQRYVVRRELEAWLKAIADQPAASQHGRGASDDQRT